ncbi:hypothetical protein SC1083_1718 [Aggregatibacter actinomycetemcomitans serotype e str. SC1083]|uniref:Uncharacterized protein n=1 Tax=Aggregatibacter actinomycetemcomitans serotype e str. SC1083 TaxID=907488 RepID=G4AA45_AGGAC|nr:hypothetical protein SC1083_1718 [Aggregatibacter actinomycetemcomitans serotype e str. SC1083]
MLNCYSAKNQKCRYSFGKMTALLACDKRISSVAKGYFFAGSSFSEL